MDTLDGRTIIETYDTGQQTPPDDFADWIIGMITGGDLRGYANKIMERRETDG